MSTFGKWLRWLAVAAVAAALGRELARPTVARIVVSKSEGRLVAYDAAGRVVRSAPATVGWGGAGPKSREGDGRTPEGRYGVCFKNPRSRFHLSLGLAYPNAADGRRGLAEGAIGPAEYAAIAAAERSARVPPWKTALGGEIFIHGERERTDATAGCVALDRADVEALFPIVDLGAEVVIRP